MIHKVTAIRLLERLKTHKIMVIVAITSVKIELIANVVQKLPLGGAHLLRYSAKCIGVRPLRYIALSRPTVCSALSNLQLA